MFKKLCENLDLLMKEHRINANELAKRTGLPSSTIKKIRKYDKPNPTLTTLLPLAQYFSITLSQLIGDEQLPRLHANESDKNYQQRVQVIPVLSREDSIAWPNNRTSLSNNSTIITEYLYSKNAFALLIDENEGDILVKGTILIVDPKLIPGNRDFVLVHKTGLKIPSLKQVIYDEDSMYLKPLIDGCKVIVLMPEHNILGVVMEYRKKLRDSSQSFDVENPKLEIFIGLEEIN